MPVCYLQHEDFHAVQAWVHWQYYREMNGKLAPNRVCDDQLILAYDFAQKYNDFDFMDAIIDHSLLFIQHGSEYETARVHGSPITFLEHLCLPFQQCRNQFETVMALWKRCVFYRMRNLLRSMIKPPWWKGWGKCLHDRFESLAEAIKCDESLPEEERHTRWQRIHDVFWEPNTHYGKHLHTRYCLVCGGLWKEETQKKRRTNSNNAAYLKLQDQRRRFRNLCDRFVYKQRSTPVTKKLMLHLALVLERGTSYIPRSTAGFLPDFGNELRDLSMMMLDEGDDCKFINPLVTSDPCIYHEHTAKGLPCYRKKLPGELPEIKIQIHWTSYFPGVDYVRNLISAIRLPELSHCPWPHAKMRPLKAPRDFPLPKSPPLPGQVRWVPPDAWEDVPLPTPSPTRVRKANGFLGNNISADNTLTWNQPINVSPSVHPFNGTDGSESSAPPPHAPAEQQTSARPSMAVYTDSRENTSDRHDSGQDKKDTKSESSNEEISPMYGTISPARTELSMTMESSNDRASSTFEPGSRPQFRARSAPARSP